MAKRPHVVLTRPAAESVLWANTLERAGFTVHCWPLIEVLAHPNPMHIHEALSAWSDYQAVMFVSRAAVKHTFQYHKPKTWGLTRCWATGPGTRQALLEAGVPEELIDSPSMEVAQFDTEALWHVVQSKVTTDRSVLLLRGSDGDKPGTTDEGVGRDWLIKQLQAKGIQVDSVAVYQRCLPVWNVQQQMQARLAATDGSIWVFSSSQSVANLAQLLPGQDWSLAKALATHERIGEAALHLGMGQVQICKPSLSDVLSSLESFA